MKYDDVPWFCACLPEATPPRSSKKTGESIPTWISPFRVSSLSGEKKYTIVL